MSYVSNILMAAVLFLTTTVAYSQAEKPNQPGQYAHIEIKHQEQSPDLCLPTCVAMVLNYYHDDKTQWTIKRLSNEHVDIFSGTTLEEVQNGIKPLGYTWDRWLWPADSIGFEDGLDAIKQSLDHGKPVIVGVRVYRPTNSRGTSGHALLAYGYDTQEREIFLMDPAREFPGKRHVSFEEFQTLWDQNGYRYALFTARKGTLPVGHRE